METTLTKDGKGIHITSENKTISSRLINKLIENMIPKKNSDNTKLELDFKSNIPTGYGLKVLCNFISSRYHVQKLWKNHER